MGENEQEKRFVDFTVEKNCVRMDLWDESGTICCLPFTVSPDEEKDYEVLSTTGELIPCIEEDFLDDFIPKLQDISLEEMKNSEEIVIAPLDDAKKGKGVYLTVGDGKASINLSINGKDTVFETFNNVEELDSFIFNLEEAVKKALEA